MSDKNFKNAIAWKDALESYEFKPSKATGKFDELRRFVDLEIERLRAVAEIMLLSDAFEALNPDFNIGYLKGLELVQTKIKEILSRSSPRK